MTHPQVLRRHRFLLLLMAAATMAPLNAQEASRPVTSAASAQPVQAAPKETPEQEPPVIDAPPPPPTAPLVGPPRAPASEKAAENAPAPSPGTPRPAQRTVPAPAAPSPRAQPSPPSGRAEPAAQTRPERPAPATIQRKAAPAPAEAIIPAPELETTEAAASLEPRAAKPSPASSKSQGADGGGNGSWLIFGILLLAAGAAAALVVRRKRLRVGERDYQSYSYEAVADATPPPRPVNTLASTPAAGPALRSRPAAQPEGPWIELHCRAVRAGVDDSEARVEFVLTVENKGTAPAEEVWVSSFMAPAGFFDEAHREQASPQNAPEARLPLPIEPGNAKRVQSAVALPRETLQGAILPVVVVNARYELPDGGERLACAAFEVGVPHDGQLLSFDVDNPSGLREGVQARVYAGGANSHEF